ncbi:MAG: hypothetical protein ACR2MD_12290 [Aridibacter sp.]
MIDENNNSGCSGRTCDWLAYNSSLGCVDGSTRSCFHAVLMEAEETVFHDSKLIKATEAINNILNILREESEERKLSLIVTDMGVLLAWAEHGGDAEGYPKDAVRANSDSKTVVEALKLKNVTGS